MEGYVIVLFLLAGVGVYWYSKRAFKKTQEMKCPNCGATVRMGDRLCSACGRDLAKK
jgi:predicted amidophosphoribosyltransferase